MSYFMSPSCVFHMWLNTSTLQTTSLLILEFFQIQLLLKTRVLDVRRKTFVVPTKWNAQLWLRRQYRHLHATLSGILIEKCWMGVSTEGGPHPGPCPDLTPLPLSNISQWQTQKPVLSFHGEKEPLILWLAQSFRFVLFLLLLLNYYFKIHHLPSLSVLESVKIQTPPLPYYFLSSTQLLGLGLFWNPGRTHLYGVAWFFIIIVSMDKQCASHTTERCKYRVSLWTPLVDKCSMPWNVLHMCIENS
jgi:hypothetical protein